MVELTSIYPIETHSPFLKKVMYFDSPVRIKPVFEHCSQEEFIKYARFIRRKANTSEPGTNLHAMYVNLYIWCRGKYRQRFL